MATRRSDLMAAIRTALADTAAPSFPAGLVIRRRTSMPLDGDAMPTAPVTMVGRAKEQPKKNSASAKAPVVDRHLHVVLDHWVAGDDPEELLEPLLAHGTAIMCAAGSFNGLARDIDEIETTWDLDALDLEFGHASQLFTVKFTTKTDNQELKQ